MLDKRPMEPYFPPVYYLSMVNLSFQDRVIAAMDAQDINKMDLHRKSGVPYHAIDKFLKRANASTNADNATAMANALGLKVDDDREYEELRELFYQLDEAQRTFLLKSVRGLLD